MSFTDAIKKSVLNGFANNDLPTSQVIVILAVTFLIGIYIYFIYKLVNRSSMYDRSYHIAMAMISVITAGIIIAMQSSIVISLGMVGALSIVRFRTAIKDTMDLLFLFWSIGEGIICGAGLFKIAIIVALMVTVGILILEYMPGNRKPYLLIINADDINTEKAILACVIQYASRWKIKSRNIKKAGYDVIFEVSTKHEKELIKAIGSMDGVVGISMLTHDGEVRF